MLQNILSYDVTFILQNIIIIFENYFQKHIPNRHYNFKGNLKKKSLKTVFKNHFLIFYLKKILILFLNIFFK